MSEILEWVDVADLLGAVGVRNLSRSGSEWSFSCFSEYHAHGDSTPSAGMNATTGLWRCRNPACGLRGNAADFLAALKGYTYSEALRVLQERYGGGEISSAPGALEEEVERIRQSYTVADILRVPPSEDEYLDRFAVHWPMIPLGVPQELLYMYERGFHPRILNDWNIGFDDLSSRITIPIHDDQGKLVGIKGRAWDPEVQPRYIIIGDKTDGFPRYGFNTYMKSMHVFGLNRVETCRGMDLADLFVVEGEINVLAMHQLGWLNAVAVAGAEFSERQRELIVRHADSVCIFFDDDAAGNAGARKVAEMLQPYIPVKIVQGAGFDAADVLDPRKAATEQHLTTVLRAAVPYLLARLTA